MSRRNVLLISYLFPPAGGVGVQRALSLARYLPQCGCKVTVLAARNPSTPVMDRALVAQIPPDVRVERVWTPELPFALRERLWRKMSGRTKVPATSVKSTGKLRGPARWIRRLLSPDPQVVWTPLALRRAERLVRQENISAVMVTAPPFSTLGIGAALKERFPELILISDFRDEWLGFYLNLDPGNRSAVRQEAELCERRCVALSDYVVAVTPLQIGDIRSRYPEQPASKFLCMPNGYDPVLWAGFTPRPTRPDRCVISLFGTVYDGYNSPRPLLDAADRLPPEQAQRIEFRFIGRIEGDQAKGLMARHARVILVGFLPYPQALRMLEETDLLLLSVDSPTAHAGKLFEYFAAGRPILALTPPTGEVARLLRETGAGWVADPKDPAAVSAMLVEALAAVAEGRFKPNLDAIAAYERPRLIRRLAEQTGLTAPQPG